MLKSIDLNDTISTPFKQISEVDFPLPSGTNVCSCCNNNPNIHNIKELIKAKNKKLDFSFKGLGKFSFSLSSLSFDLSLHLPKFKRLRDLGDLLLSDSLNRLNHLDELKSLLDNFSFNTDFKLKLPRIKLPKFNLGKLKFPKFDFDFDSLLDEIDYSDLQNDIGCSKDKIENAMEKLGVFGGENSLIANAKNTFDDFKGELSETKNLLGSNLSSFNSSLKDFINPFKQNINAIGVNSLNSIKDFFTNNETECNINDVAQSERLPLVPLNKFNFKFNKSSFKNAKDNFKGLKNKANELKDQFDDFKDDLGDIEDGLQCINKEINNKINSFDRKDPFERLLNKEQEVIKSKSKNFISEKTNELKQKLSLKIPKNPLGDFSLPKEITNLGISPNNGLLKTMASNSELSNVINTLKSNLSDSVKNPSNDFSLSSVLNQSSTTMTPKLKGVVNGNYASLEKVNKLKSKLNKMKS